jgi:FKBP-type peptidyl-prolyl cis-trans isomerase FkpA
MRFTCKLAIYFISFMVIIASCQRNEQIPAGKQGPEKLKEPLIKANQQVMREETDQINDYVRRHKLDMETTSTGLRFMITKNGIGAKAEPGMKVKLDYAVTLLTGDTVYTGVHDGPLIFEIGKGQVISGLEEAILMLRVGDRAKIIIPSHLAYGLIGDQKKILNKASLVYDLEFISMF